MRVEVIGNLINDLSRAPRAIVRAQLVNPSTMAALSITYEVSVTHHPLDLLVIY